MFAEANEPPMKARFKFLAAKYIIKVPSLSRHAVTDRMYSLLDLAKCDSALQYLQTTFPIFNTFVHFSRYTNIMQRSVQSPQYMHNFYTLYEPSLIISYEKI